MAHRGKLNVLANILQVDPALIFHKVCITHIPNYCFHQPRSQACTLAFVACSTKGYKRQKMRFGPDNKAIFHLSALIQIKGNHEHADSTPSIGDVLSHLGRLTSHPFTGANT